MFQLFAITNRKRTRNRPLTTVIGEIAGAGTDAVILREKDLSPAELYNLAAKVKRLCSGTDTRLIINSSVETALAVDADGVHLGYGSLPPEAARRLLPGKVLGISVHSLTEAREAEAVGADYVLAGHVFATGSKPGQPGRGLEFIRELRANLSIPVIAIGGIDRTNAPVVVHAGASGIAVMSLAMESEDITGVLRSLRQSVSG